MAFESNGPVMLALPPFRGVTRRIILIALAAFLGLAFLGFAMPRLAQLLLGLTVLAPALALRGEVWQFVTYPFVSGGLLSTAFALLSVWFFAAPVEDERGSRWLSDYFFATTVGGGLAASLLTFLLDGRGGWLAVDSAAAGLWPFVLAVVVAFAYFAPEAPVRFYFLITLKAKYLAAIYVLFYLALSLRGGDRFGALVALLNAGCGYLYLRFARLNSRRGLRTAASERWFGLRNAYYRAKRRRAARKFTLYMRKQGKEVSLDEDGRYIDPLGRYPKGEKRDQGEKRDPNDRRWMN